ncbi:MAG TPA: cellulase family glycosylhydrolase [Mycobacteriales bacterium]|nr:cellulase family glycosylhydrolase [Mycobacteriales bacterium]
MRRSTAAITVNGQRSTWLGANFWSRTGGPLMWRNYDPAVIEQELAVLAEHGLGLTRSFFYWPDFMPEPDRLDEQLVERFADFLDRHSAAGMTTIPTFIVGHMSGENWDPAWRNGRDLYGDVWMVARQAWFAREIVRRFADHPAIAGWLVSNEVPIYGGEASRETVASWAELVVEAIRGAGGRQPVSLGDGAWGLEMSGRDTGFSMHDQVKLCDFLGPHVYRMEDDEIRQHYSAAWVCELASTYGVPVVLEEFGVSSDFTSDENGAHYYRQSLHNSLLAGSTGWIAWNNTDYDDLIEQDPYRHHPFELHFGLTDHRGNPKPQLRELKAFAEILRDVDFEHCTRSDVDTALVVPSFLDTIYPFTVEADRTDLVTTLRQAYVSGRLADVPMAATRESDGIGQDARLYVVPSVKQLLGPTWRELERLAHDGACVYVSYSAGAHGNQRGPWHSHLNRMFGVEHQLRYGLVDPVEDDTITFTLTRPFGGLSEGSRLEWTAAGTPHSRAYLPVRATEAEVLAEDAHGRPALLLRRIGAGSIVFCTYPIEQMAAVTPRVNPDATPALYDALARHAGVRRPVTVGDPRIAVDTVDHESDGQLVWLVSHSSEEVEVKPVVASDGSLQSLAGAVLTGAVTLLPYGVAVLRLGR